MKAYHFVADTLRDGRPIPADGEWLEYKGPLAMCESGLHASRDPFDALKYAPGATLCLVEVDGEIIEGSDKLVASRRMISARRDATTMLREFARAQALSVIQLWNAPAVVREYLEGSDEFLRAAAGDAAWYAARYAAWYAPRYAAWTAARYVAEDVAEDAAEAVAEDAARAAAGDAAGDAAWYAAWNAARAAAWAAAREDFSRRVNELFQEVA